MIVTWTVLHGTAGSRCPWSPAGASWWVAGHSSAGRPEPPTSDGSWWSVLAGWADEDDAALDAPQTEGEVWHVVLEPFSCHGDVVLADGSRPFDGVPTGRQAGGAVALITVAGPSADDGREREFFRRFLHASRDVAVAPGHVVSLVQAPAADVDRGPVLTLSAWADLDAGLEWAYSRSRPHSRAVVRQRTHGLVTTSGSLRCVVRSSSGSLGDLGDPLAGLRGSLAPRVEQPA